MEKARSRELPLSIQDFDGGNWPFLLWLLTAAAQKTGRTQLAERAFNLAKKRLLNDQWPEYYDGKNGRLIGKEARMFQTWTIAGFLTAIVIPIIFRNATVSVATREQDAPTLSLMVFIWNDYKALLKTPENLSIISFSEQTVALACNTEIPPQ